MSGNHESEASVVILRFDTHSFSLLSFNLSGDVPSECIALLTTGVPDRAAEVLSCLEEHGFRIRAFNAVDTDNNLQSVVYTLVKREH